MEFLVAGCWSPVGVLDLRCQTVIEISFEVIGTFNRKMFWRQTVTHRSTSLCHSLLRFYLYSAMCLSIKKVPLEQDFFLLI